MTYGRKKYVVYVGTYTHERTVSESIYMIWMQKAEK